MKGVVFNIQKFSIHDGPGIRTTVFLKGCPLRCKWCANPESQLPYILILHDKEKCTHCLKCVQTCENNAITYINNEIKIDQSKCNGCLECVKNCPSKALSNEGEYKTVEDIVSICMQDIDFYEESNGGITISGGEGFSQPLFLEKLIYALKEKKLHIAIETTGYVNHEIFKKLAPLFDLLLFDVKHINNDKHYTYTHVKNDLIIQNLKWAIKHNINILPRIPVIPHFNDSLDDAKALAKHLNSLNLHKVQLLPFHQMGENKYKLLNKIYEYNDVKALHKEDLIDYQNIFINNNIDCYF